MTCKVKIVLGIESLTSVFSLPAPGNFHESDDDLLALTIEHGLKWKVGNGWLVKVQKWLARH